MTYFKIKLVKFVGNNVRWVLCNMGYNISSKKIHNTWRKLSTSIPAYVMSERTFVSASHWVAPPTVKFDWSKNSLHIMVLIGCNCVLSHGHFASIVDRQISCQIKHAVSRLVKHAVFHLVMTFKVRTTSKLYTHITQ